MCNSNFVTWWQELGLYYHIIEVVGTSQIRTNTTSCNFILFVNYKICIWLFLNAFVGISANDTAGCSTFLNLVFVKQ